MLGMRLAIAPPHPPNHFRIFSYETNILSPLTYAVRSTRPQPWPSIGRDVHLHVAAMLRAELADGGRFYSPRRGYFAVLACRVACAKRRIIRSAKHQMVSGNGSTGRGVRGTWPCACALGDPSERGQSDD